MSTPASDTYPRDREAEIALSDGSTVHVRPVRPDDAAGVRTFLDGVSRESIGFRFFGSVNLDWASHWAVDVDYGDRYGLVAETGSPRRIIAHAAYIRLDPPARTAAASDRVGATAEVAFLVADAWQGKGISTILLGQLATVADQHGIERFTAEVLPVNHRMVAVFRQSGFPVELRSAPGTLTIKLPTSLSEEAIARFEQRERLAAVAAVQSFLAPRSIAVIGASGDRQAVGGKLLENIVTSGFTGAVYPVNRHVEVVQSLVAYPSISELPEPVELAVVAVPAAAVLSVARECGATGVRALLVISAGFGELGGEGRQRQLELLAICRDAGMRIVGPNCLGVINTNADVRLNATFAPNSPLPGRVGFMSQSGGLGIALIEAAASAGLGLSSFVSVGNKVDLSGNDMLSYWEEDPDTDVALLYLESFGEPRKFARRAPRLARRKPVIAVKSGRSVAGSRASTSHTGALISASDVTVDALFAQAGVIRTDTLHEMLDVARLLSFQPVPNGGRVVIVTNAGGPGIMCADACQAAGIEVPELPAEVRAQLARFLPPAASFGNPIDMIATATAEQYRRTATTVIEARVCDVVLAVFVPALGADPAAVASSLREVAESDPGVPLAAVFMTGEGPPPELTSPTSQVPGFAFPEEAVRAVALATRYGRWRAQPPQEPARPSGTAPDRAASIISRELAAGAGWLSPSAVRDLLECYRLPMIATRLAADAEQAAAVAGELAGPVALKAIAAGLVRKSDAGGVRLGVQGRQQVHAAAEAIERSVCNAGYEFQGLVIQPMAPPGVELIVGVVHDPAFGPVIACGAGGTTAELIGDVSVRITPLGARDAGEMLRSLRTFPLLDGYRGNPRCRVEAIEDALLRVSALVENHPEIVELDCNPLVAGPEGALIVDARVRIEASPSSRPLSALRQ